MLQHYSVKCLEKSYDGIFCLQLRDKKENESFYLCVCYLPPENSSRGGHGEDFFDMLLSGVSKYKDCGKIQICGDFNARTGKLPDIIEGIDSIRQRKTIDYETNSQGRSFIDFCVFSNLCCLAGRYTNDNFTCVSHKGRSVVDDCIVPYYDLNLYSNFDVLLIAELIDKYLFQY